MSNVEVLLFLKRLGLDKCEKMNEWMNENKQKKTIFLVDILKESWNLNVLFTSYVALLFTLNS